jgi:hypothetical protein
MSPARVKGFARLAGRTLTRVFIHTASAEKEKGTVLKGPSPFFFWWRRRESNPRPRALRPEVYMLIHVYCFNRLLPDGQGRQTAIPGEI